MTFVLYQCQYASPLQVRSLGIEILVSIHKQVSLKWWIFFIEILNADFHEPKYICGCLIAGAVG
jgi:hypothetical protein